MKPNFGYPLKKKMQFPIETVGVICGIIGAFIVANAMPQYGYPLFTLSSIMLTYTAFKQNNYNLVALQGVFMIANINGLYTFFLK